MTGLKQPCRTPKPIIGANLETRATDDRIELNHPDTETGNQRRGPWLYT